MAVRASGLTPEQIRPNGLILCYPVVTAGEGCHRGSVERLLWGQMLTEEEQMIPERGTEEKEMLRELISLEKQVGSHTPPVFLWHTVTDQTVPVRNALIWQRPDKERRFFGASPLSRWTPRTCPGDGGNGRRAGEQYRATVPELDRSGGKMAGAFLEQDK